MEVSGRERQLERELDSLRACLEEKEGSLVQAAELGQALLRENGALEERLAQVNKETTQRTEASNSPPSAKLEQIARPCNSYTHLPFI